MPVQYWPGALSNPLVEESEKMVQTFPVSLVSTCSHLLYLGRCTSWLRRYPVTCETGPFLSFKSHNISKTIVNHPPNHHFYRWYVYHSQSWMVSMTLFYPQKVSPRKHSQVTMLLKYLMSKSFGKWWRFHQTVRVAIPLTGWWFQTWFIFHNIWDNPNPIE